MWEELSFYIDIYIPDHQQLLGHYTGSKPGNEKSVCLTGSGLIISTRVASDSASCLGGWVGVGGGEVAVTC